ncbi:MAG: hypothetical protein AAF432_09970 [Planctomycetota bacterium]
MDQPDEQSSKHGAEDQLCEAATAVYYAVVCLEATRRGHPIPIPELLCPVGVPPCPCQIDPALLHEAEQFLVRMGMIYFDGQYRTRLTLDGDDV